MEDNVKKKMYVCVQLGHFTVQQKLTEHVKSPIVEKKKPYKKQSTEETMQMAD